VRWFCTHKLAWNASNPFPHRLFRWRGRCGSELLALMTAPIGTDGDPLAMERQRILWQQVSGCEETLWLPGVGDHGGGPTAAMLEQLALWQHQPAAAPQRHGTLRAHLARLEPLAASLPVWRDELYLELHRGCATSRPDQKRHNRSLERLLREAEVALALRRPLTDAPPPDWRPLLFQQFHDILPGTSVPEVFDQAGPQWRRARRQARRQRDAALGAGRQRRERQPWRVMQLQPLPAAARTVRLPGGAWSLRESGQPLPAQPAPGGGVWLQLPGIAGIDDLLLERAACGEEYGGAATAAAVRHPVHLRRLEDAAGPRWRLGNGLVAAVIGPAGVEQVDADDPAHPLLTAPLAWRRWGDRGEYWDAWDIAADYRDHPLGWSWDGMPRWVERGPLCSRFVWRGHCGASPVRLDGRLLAGSPALELTLRVEWRQLHELLRLEIPLAGPAARWASDTPGGVIERPARPVNAREEARWEVPAVSWIASVRDDGGLAVLLDGPQGVSGSAAELGVSLLRAPTWPDPGADNGLQRLRLALMPTPAGWRQAAVPDQARRLREPLWCRPVEDPPFGWQALPPLPPDLQLVDLHRAEDGSDALILVVQNLGPCRRRLDLPAPWRRLERLRRLDQPEPAPASADPLLLLPWQMGIWRWRPPQG
jgi:alpha-mannosidase